MDSREKAISMLFGEFAISYISALEKILESLRGSTYTFIGEDEFKIKARETPLEGHRIYWFEILERAHWTATVSLYRYCKWLDGVVIAIQDNNFLAFSANYRGLLESSADTIYSLLEVPKALAKVRNNVIQVFNNNSSAKHMFHKDLEDILIHFLYARHAKTVEQQSKDIDVTYPESHKAKYIRTYLESFGKPEILDCYSELCDVTHPGLLSVWSFVGTPVDEDYIVGDIFDAQLIEHFCDKYKNVSQCILEMPLNIALLTLKVLNTFNVDAVYTEKIELIGFDGIPLWSELKVHIE